MPRMDVAPLRAARAADACAGCRASSPTPSSRRASARADLVVLPYREIDQSGVLFTALAFGAPLLLTAVGGFPEVAAPAPPRSSRPATRTRWPRALGALLADPARRDRAGARRRAAPPPAATRGTRSPQRTSRSTETSAADPAARVSGLAAP